MSLALLSSLSGSVRLISNYSIPANDENVYVFLLSFLLLSFKYYFLNK